MFTVAGREITVPIEYESRSHLKLPKVAARRLGLGRSPRLVVAGEPAWRVPLHGRDSSVQAERGRPHQDVCR